MTPGAPAVRRDDTIYTRNEVENLIAEGRTIIIVDGDVLKVDAWLPYHPGGDKAVKHMVGRDATDEVTAYADIESWSTASLMLKLGCTLKGQGSA